jgi:methanogenic corrinoid protein MtbC1
VAAVAIVQIPSMVVATLSGDRHEIGALLVAAGASLEGWQVTYLGSDLPIGEIAAAAVETDARAVALSMGYVTDRQYTLQQLRALRAQLPADVGLLLGGAAGSRLAPDLAGTGIRVLQDLAALRTVLRGDG